MSTNKGLNLQGKPQPQRFNANAQHFTPNPQGKSPVFDSTFFFILPACLLLTFFSSSSSPPLNLDQETCASDRVLDDGDDDQARRRHWSLASHRNCRLCRPHFFQSFFLSQFSLTYFASNNRRSKVQVFAILINLLLLLHPSSVLCDRHKISSSSSVRSWCCTYQWGRYDGGQSKNC